jgi:hypothetical protein
MADQIIELLENSKLRQQVMKTIQDVWSYAGTLYANPTEDMEKYLEENKEASLWEEAWWRAEDFGEIDEIEQAFDKYVIQKMAKPYILTLEELFNAFLDSAKPSEEHIYEFESFDSEDCNKLYMIFINHVKNHILSYRSSDPFPICLVAEDPDAENVEEEKPLWQKNGVTVRSLHGADVIKERPAGKKLYHLLALIEGNISSLACSRLQYEMSQMLPTAIRSADLLQTRGFGEYKVVEPTMPFWGYVREIEGLPWGEKKLIETGKPLIRQYLDSYYSEPTKKDSIERRIRNGVYLLTQSDNQPSDAVGLALSITAVEALLGEKSQELATKLADNVAVLLEPDLKQRHSATEFAKDLYNIRSRALHGEQVEAESGVRVHARHLAAAVLSGVVSRRDFLRRSGYEPESPQKLLQDLRKGRFEEGQQAVGAEEYNIRELWGNTTTGKKDSSL